MGGSWVYKNVKTVHVLLRYVRMVKESVLIYALSAQVVSLIIA